MRRFSSYGPVDPEEHDYAPRKELIERAYTQLRGDNPRKGGHYFTVWAPRQTGKTWIMLQVLFRLRKYGRFDILKINLQHLKDLDNAGMIISAIAEEMFKWYEKESSQKVEAAVVRALYEETLGQPGLTCRFGELLTETYNHDPQKSLPCLKIK